MLDNVSSEHLNAKEPPITGLQLKTWIDLTFKKPGDPQRLTLRNKLISSYSGFFKDLSEATGYVPFVMMGHQDYGVDAQEIYDYVLSYESAVSNPPTLEQMEAIGIAALMGIALPKRETVIINPGELKPRITNALSLNAHEDWLTSLAFVTYYKDFQFEANVKNRAYKEGITYLQTLKAGEITFDDIQHVYRNLIKAVYPSIEDEPPIIVSSRMTIHREMALLKNMLNKKLLVYSELIENESPDRLIRKNLNDLLDDYNRALEDREDEGDIYKHAERLAEIFAKFVFIHPHPDGNNSMARILTNNYLITHGFKQIDWSKLKTDGKANEQFNSYVSNWWLYKEWDLISWFREKLEKP